MDPWQGLSCFEINGISLQPLLKENLKNLLSIFMPTMLKVFLKFNYKRELFVSFNRDSELTVFLIYVNKYMIMLIVICY